MPKREILIPIGPSIAYIPLTKGQFALIDSIDVTGVNDRSWQADVFSGKFYAKTGTKIDGKQCNRLLHRFLLNVTDLHTQVDHCNGNTLDNRRVNIRACTQTQNKCNAKLSKNSSSGLKGVSWVPRISKWRSQIQTGKTKHYLGVFADKEEAHRAYCEAADQLHREFANHG